MVSVIVPVYNVAQYLRECLDSIVSQTCHDLEIIIINDGSTDESGRICDQYAAMDHRIHVIHQDNRGLSAARNAGIDIAKGKYLVFVDSDDYMHPECIEIMLALCQEHSADMCACSFDSLTGTEITPQRTNPSEVPEILVGDKKFSAYLCERKIYPSAWAKLYKAELFHDIRYPLGKFHEDTFVIHKLLHAAKRIVYTEKSLYVYRRRPESITLQAYSPKKLDAIEGRLEVAAFIEQAYPRFLPYAQSNILFSCTDIVIGYVRCGAKPSPEARKLLQSLYRKYLYPHLKYKTSMKLKVFAIAASINLHLAELLASSYFKLH